MNIIAYIMMGFGAMFFLGAAIGILRFPDFYTRMHAAGKGDTLSSIMMLGGLAILNFHGFTDPASLSSLKILCIIFFIFITSPTSNHALMQAGFEAGMKPWKKSKEEDVIRK